MRAVMDVACIESLTEPQLRELTARLITEVRHKQATIDKLTHEMAVLKRLKFAARSESFSAEQKSLLEEAIDADLEALSRELEREREAAGAAPRRPEGTTEAPAAAGAPAAARYPPRARGHRLWLRLPLKRIGEDVAEKLDYVPGVFTVERHIRGKWVCASARP
jgi:transposase